MAPFMTFCRAFSIPALAAGLTAALALSACAGSPEQYPNLSIRDVERINGSFEPIPTQKYVSAPPSGEVLDRLAKLRGDAASAHRSFLDTAKLARGPVTNARGAKIGSSAWSIAQVALADLESSRSTAMVALADLDRIYVSAQLQAAELSEIEAARDEVIALVDSQDEQISALYAELGEPASLPATEG